MLSNIQVLRSGLDALVSVGEASHNPRDTIDSRLLECVVFPMGQLINVLVSVA